MPQETLLFSIKTNNGPVNSLSVSPDNRYILTTCGKFTDFYGNITFNDNNLCLTDIKEKKIIKKWKTHDLESEDTAKICADFINNDIALSLSIDEKIKIWDLKKFNLKTSYNIEKHYVESYSLKRQKLILITGGNYKDKSVRVWDLKNGNCRNILTGHGWSVDSVDINNEITMAASSSNLYDDKPIIIWDLTENKIINKFGDRNMKITKVKFYNDKVAVSTGEDMITRFWEIKTGKIFKYFQDIDSYPVGFYFIKNNKYLISAAGAILKGAGNKIYVWDINNNELVYKTYKHKSGIQSFNVTNNEKNVVTGCINGKINVWINPFLVRKEDEKKK